MLQEHEAALRYFQRANQLDPGFAYAYTLSGHEYFACEDFEQARKLYETALSMDARHYNAWCDSLPLTGPHPGIKCCFCAKDRSVSSAKPPASAQAL